MLSATRQVGGVPVLLQNQVFGEFTELVYVIAVVIYISTFQGGLNDWEWIHPRIIPNPPDAVNLGALTVAC